jgi:hypothetical protein
MSDLELFLLTGVLTPNFNTMDLGNFFGKNKKLHIQIIAVTWKVMSCRSISKKKIEKKWKTKILWAKQTIFWEPCPLALGQFQPHGNMEELLRKYMKNELNTSFQQKFGTRSYGVRIGRAWCSRKACEVCSSRKACEVCTCLKEKIEKKLFFFSQAARSAIDQFLVSRNFRG